MAVIDDATIASVEQDLLTGASYRAIARKHNISHQTVLRIRDGKHPSSQRKKAGRCRNPNCRMMLRDPEAACLRCSTLAFMTMASATSAA